MQLGDFVQAMAGDYTGYYGVVVEIGDAPDHEGQVLVRHKPDFSGFWINVDDLMATA